MSDLILCGWCGRVACGTLIYRSRWLEPVCMSCGSEHRRDRGVIGLSLRLLVRR